MPRGQPSTSPTLRPRPHYPQCGNCGMAIGAEAEEKTLVILALHGPNGPGTAMLCGACVGLLSRRGYLVGPSGRIWFEDGAELLEVRLGMSQLLLLALDLRSKSRRLKYLRAKLKKARACIQ